MTNLSDRKIAHIDIVLNKKVEPVAPPFEKYALPYSALPEIDMEEIDTSVSVFEKNLSMPFFISSMTGGPAKASMINQNLAIACEKAKIGLGLGSMRVILKNPESLKSFQVKHLCPSIPLFGNIGLVQLNYGVGIDEIRKIIDLTEIDGIFFHINHLQEAIQPEGDTNYKGLYEKFEKLIEKIDIPVIVKEVGSGIDMNTAKKLYEIGVKWIDTQGVGGTSWAWVEGYRRDDNLGEIFKSVGISTDESIIQCKKIDGLKIIGSGGIRSGIDIAKSLMLGADLSASAKPFLEPGLNSAEDVYKLIMQYNQELRVAMFCSGAKDINTLKSTSLI